MKANLQSFELLYSRVTLSLLNALDIKTLTPESEYFNHPIFTSLRRCLTYHLESNLVFRDLEFGKNRLLLKHLSELHDIKMEIFKFYKKKLLKTVPNEPNNFPGVRFEINIAARLAREGLDFDTIDPPDFYIPSKSCSIECTVAQVPKGKIRNDLIERKIGSSVDMKSTKYSQKSFYEDYSTALFIDATNILSLMDPQLKRTTEEFAQILEKVIAEKLQITKFGSILIFYYLIPDGTTFYTNPYRRFDNKKIKNTLQTFLDSSFPFRNPDSEKQEIMMNIDNAKRLHVPRVG